ncbi:hypothetical protein CsatA_017068 [Cannabis sativa]
MMWRKTLQRQAYIHPYKRATDEDGGDIQMWVKKKDISNPLLVWTESLIACSVYSDSLALGTTINNGEMYFNKLGALFEDVIALLSKFLGAVLSHVARSENLAAHGLAKHALQLNDKLSWFEEVPALVAGVGIVNS